MHIIIHKLQAYNVVYQSFIRLFVLISDFYVSLNGGIGPVLNNQKTVLHYGIIGYPLTHSFSPAYFKSKFARLQLNAMYMAYSLADISAFPALLKANPGIKGLNVTIPYKESVMSYLHETDVVASVVGAVNCISIESGVKKGYNTDVVGFQRSLMPLLKGRHSKALILGTGGSSKAVAHVLRGLGIAIMHVSATGKTGALSYSDLTPEIVAEYKLIVNTTPVGMYPEVYASPSIPYSGVGQGHLLYDLIYNPVETQFLIRGKAQGAVIKNGFEMLVQQAEASWDIWTRPPSEM